jgi:hypothetical protein
VSDGLDPTSLPNGLDITSEDWQQTPHSGARPPQTSGSPRSAGKPALLQLQLAPVHRYAYDKASATDERGGTTPAWW